MIVSLTVVSTFCAENIVSSNLTSQPRWDDKLDFSAIEVMLQTLPIIKKINMRSHLITEGFLTDFEGEVFLVTLQNGFKAVFKPYQKDKMRDACAEVIAYKVAWRFLGQRLVPPTVLRTIDKRTGSLQWYVEPSVDALESAKYEKAMAQLSKKTTATINLFCFVFGQWDTGPHNIIIQYNNGKPCSALIDNTGIINRQKVRYGDFPFVRLCYSEKLNTNDWNAPFTFRSNTILPNLQAINTLFGSKLSLSIKEGLVKHKESITYCVWHNSLWRQFHKNSLENKPSYTTYYPKDILEKLINMTKDDLKELYLQTENGILEEDNVLTEAFFDDIMQRRGQVVTAAKSLTT